LFQSVGIELVNVAYKGQPPALLDLIRGEVHFEIVSLLLALPHINEGSVKPLAVMTRERIKELPAVPTISEAGYPNATYLPWYGIYVPAKTPDAIVTKIHDGVNRALSSPEVQRRLELADIPGKPMPLEELASFMKADYETLLRVVNASGAALQPNSK
jgi:tripartite-type tricarboxylate transporter receptor subunit TctC